MAAAMSDERMVAAILGMVIAAVTIVTIRAMFREWLTAKYGRNPKLSTRAERERYVQEQAEAEQARHVEDVRRRERSQVGKLTEEVSGHA